MLHLNRSFWNRGSYSLCPSKSTTCYIILHFSGFSLRPAEDSCSVTASRCFRWSSKILEKTSILSMYEVLKGASSALKPDRTLCVKQSEHFASRKALLWIHTSLGVIFSAVFFCISFYGVTTSSDSEGCVCVTGSLFGGAAPFRISIWTSPVFPRSPSPRAKAEW